MKENPQERYPQAYIDYLVQFQAVRDYFECHEILEDYWKEHPDSPFRESWVMLIQLAVGLYHQRRGNMRGAFKLLTGALRRYHAGHMQELGVDSEELRERISRRILDIISTDIQSRDVRTLDIKSVDLKTGQQVPFEDLDFPIVDAKLVERCQFEAVRLGKIWGQKSDMNDTELLNRHLLRDVGAARRQRLAVLEMTALRSTKKKDSDTKEDRSLH